MNYQKVIIMAVLGAISESMTIGCAVQAAPVATPAGILGTGPSEEIPDTDCVNAMGVKLTEHPTIKMRLVLNQKGKLLKDLGDNQEIVRNVTNNGVNSPLPKNLGNLWPTNLDLGFENKEPNKYYVPITILVRPTRKNDTIFLRQNVSAEPESDKNSASAVTVQKGSANKFCIRSVIGSEKIGKKNFEKITFGSMLGLKEYASINIGLLIYNNEDESWYPVYIDPNVKNEG